MTDRVAAAGAALARLCPPGRIGVALSGGSDSTALMHLAAAQAPGRVEAATVDHRLRRESAEEARMAGRAAAALDIPHEILPWAEAPGHGNLQAAAREARLALLSEWAARRGLAAVLLGHTLDDQAETVLMRLGRGAGIDGLSGMAEARESHGLLWLRPLLGLRRAALRDWLAAQGVTWADDPSNDDPRFDRVRARQALAALAPLGVTAEGLAATADRLRTQRRVLETAMESLAAGARRWTADGAEIDRAALAAAETDTAHRLLADTLMRLSGAPYPPRGAALARLAAAIRDGTPGTTLSGCLIRADGPAARISREPAHAPDGAGPRNMPD